RIGKADLHREFTAILASPCEAQAAAHHAGTRGSEITIHVLIMKLAQLLGNEQLNRLAYKLLLRVTEKPLGPGIRFCDSASTVNNDEPFGRGLEIILVRHATNLSICTLIGSDANSSGPFC